MQRNVPLDLVKGWCVLAMAINHAIDYFAYGELSLRYVHFVTGAFLFVSGYIVTHLSAGRHDLDSRPNMFGFRLLFRGVRLLLLVGILNLLLDLLLPGTAKLNASKPWATFVTLYFTGNYHEVSFSLLIPIGYVLIGLGILRLAGMLQAVWVVSISTIIFAYCCIVSLAHDLNFYTSFLAVGLTGAALGYVSHERVTRFCRRLSLVALVYLPSLLGISFLPQHFLLYTYSVAATVLVLYAVSSRLPFKAWIPSQLLLWGRYSLILYLAQIGLLFIFARFLRPLQIGYANVVIGLALICILQSPLCLAMDRIRAKSGVLDRSYKLFFA